MEAAWTSPLELTLKKLNNFYEIHRWQCTHMQMASVHFSSWFYFLFVCVVGHCDQNWHRVRIKFQRNSAAQESKSYLPPEAVGLVTAKYCRTVREIQGTDDHQMNKYHSRIFLKVLSDANMNTLTEITSNGTEYVTFFFSVSCFDNMWTWCCEICTTDNEAEHLLPPEKWC